MSTKQDLDLAANEQIYLPSFRRLLRAIELTDGFVLLPVEIQGQDTAYSLLHWLTKKGHECTPIEVKNRFLPRLVAPLFEAKPGPNGVVMVIIDSGVLPVIFHELRLLNQRRDSVAQSLNVPLLWCGPRELFDLTWRLAPDFWSIADVPRGIDCPVWMPPRQRSTTTAWAQASLQTFHAYNDALAQRDHRNAIRLGLVVVEGYASKLDFHQAQRELATLESLLSDCDDTTLVARVHLLRAKVALAIGNSNDVLRAVSDFLRINLPKNHELVADAQLIRGHVYMSLDILDEARAAYEYALRYYSTQPGYSRKLGDVHLALGDYETRLGHVNQAETHYQSADTEYGRVTDIHGMIGSANVLLARGELRAATSRKQDAEILFLKALSTYTEAHATVGVINCLRALARIYVNLGRLDEARETYKQALADLKRVGFVPWIDALKQELDALPSQ